MRAMYSLTALQLTKMAQCIVLLTKTGPRCISFRSKITVSLSKTFPDCLVRVVPQKKSGVQKSQNCDCAATPFKKGSAGSCGTAVRDGQGGPLRAGPTFTTHQGMASVVEKGHEPCTNAQSPLDNADWRATPRRWRSPISCNCRTNSDTGRSAAWLGQPVRWHLLSVRAVAITGLSAAPLDCTRGCRRRRIVPRWSSACTATACVFW